MSGNSAYLKAAIAAWMNGTAMPTAPSGLYVALFNGDPDSGGTEVTTSFRAAGRPAATFTRSAGVLTSNATCSFGAAPASSTATYAALFDAASSGNQLQSAALTGGSVTSTIGVTYQFASGALVASQT